LLSKKDNKFLVSIADFFGDWWLPNPRALVFEMVQQSRMHDLALDLHDDRVQGGGRVGRDKE